MHAPPLTSRAPQLHHSALQGDDRPPTSWGWGPTGSWPCPASPGNLARPADWTNPASRSDACCLLNVVTLWWPVTPQSRKAAQFHPSEVAGCGHWTISLNPDPRLDFSWSIKQNLERNPLRFSDGGSARPSHARLPLHQIFMVSSW